MSTATKTEKDDVIQRLSDIEVQEVSIVDKGANRKKWAFVKSAGSTEETQEVVDRFFLAKQGDEDALIAILRELLSQLSQDVLARLGLQRLVPESATAGAEAEASGGGGVEMKEVEKIRILEDQLRKSQEELAAAKVALEKVGEPQSGREPRNRDENVKGDIKTLGCKPLHK